MTPIEDFYGYESFDGGDGFAAILAIFYLIYLLLVFGISIAQYVLQSVGFYTIAKRRDIRNPWLSWIPLGNLWILGCISDQYRYVTKGKNASKRKWLMALSLLSGGLAAAGVVAYFIQVFQMLMDGGMWEPVRMMSTVMCFLGIGLVVLCLSVALAVIQYMALYDLYVSCEPKNGTLFLVLSIFVSITMPLLVFLSRKKDLGMPPRKTQLSQGEQNPAEDDPIV